MSRVVATDGGAALADRGRRQLPAGATALLVSGLVERRLVTGSPAYDVDLRRFGSFLSAQVEPSGAFLASFLGTVNPTQFTYSFSIFILAMVVLGGLGSVWGVVLGAVALSAINSWLLPDVLYDVPARIGLDFDLSQISAGIYGVLIVVIMLLRPQGLLPERRSQRMEKGLTAPRPRRAPGAAGRATVGP